MALQVGREGRPLETWPLTLGRGEHTQREFDLPLDAEFVGFRAAKAVEGTIAELSVSPRDVVESRKSLSCRDNPLGCHVRARSNIFSR
jgi:hypothetical protein